MLKGIEMFPVTLRSLEITGFLIRSDDLKIALLTSFKSLYNLCLSRCGKSGNYGVTPEVFKTMATLKHLDTLDIVDFNEEKKQIQDFLLNRLRCTFKFGPVLTKPFRISIRCEGHTAHSVLRILSKRYINQEEQSILNAVFFE